MSSAAPDTSIEDAPPVPQAEEPLPKPPSRKKTPKPQNMERSASATSSAASTSSTDNDAEWTARNSFTADSPYFNAFCETEVKQLHTLSDSLREIASRTQTLTKTGMIMSEAAKRLSSSCKFVVTQPGPEDETEEERQERVAAMRQNQQMRRQAVGEEMANFLEVLGDMLDEIATAQVHMCQSLDETLGESLNAFCSSELQTVAVLQQEAMESTDAAEQGLSKFLNGRGQQGNMNFGSDGDTGSGNNSNNNSFSNLPPSGSKGSAGELASRLKNTWRKTNMSLRRGDSGNDNGSTNNNSTPQKDFQGTPLTPEQTAAWTKATIAANFEMNLQQIRQAQANAELKRFQLMKHLIAIRHRRSFELGESAAASVHGMRAYYHHCAAVVAGMLPKFNKIQAAQHELRVHHDTAIVPTWKERQVRLEMSVKNIQHDAEQARRKALAVAEVNMKAVKDQSLVQDEIENHLWDLPIQLAECTQYQRDGLSGVLIEGWLYKKSSAMLSLQPWQRRWFVMDKDAIYYFRSENEKTKESGNERVKVGDVVLTTVRVLTGPDNPRFCFQIVTPTEKPLTLQARGPIEYRTWVDGIRANTEQQLVHGNPHRDSLTKNIGKKSNRRGSGTDGGGNAVAFPNDPPVEFRNTSTGNNEGIDDESFQMVHTPITSPITVKILEANPFCADCGAPNPDWAALNLGVLVCLECSGVHRSLGVHVSKVRSLRLDSLTDGEARLLLRMGNNKANAIWEAGIGRQQGWKKPESTADRKARDDWIRSKYMWKGFVDISHEHGATEDERNEKFSRDLYEAARQGDVIGVANAIAHGGRVDWMHPDEGKKTPLHICALAHPPDGVSDDDWTGIECAELLLQNGAKLDVLDASAHGVLDCALLNGANVPMIDFLTSKS